MKTPAELLSRSPSTKDCSVCLDLLSDPVTVPCGHSYCLRCIRDYWDQMGPAGGCFCPQCRRRFRVHQNKLNCLNFCTRSKA
uniref:RING-type domain-containing protein n=1 Tax=Astyanax mexicanus TaxID=7994 RepID=A0A3B1ITJ6_ASTMX